MHRPSLSLAGNGRLAALSAQAIDVWLCFYQEIADERLLADLAAVLSEAERDQQRRFHFADDRLRYLVTRTMVRTVLSRYASVAPAEWRFATNAWGRPEIADAEGSARGLAFNVSHTRGLIALAVSRGRAIGVDVENLRVREVSIGIAERFFSPGESAALACVPRAMQQERFFEYWTFKESYIKARGKGLSIPLDQFSFDLAGEGAVCMSVDPRLCDDEQRWRFWQFRPTPAYLLAVCAERSDGGEPSVTVRRTIPTVMDELLPLAALRRSDRSPSRY